MRAGMEQCNPLPVAICLIYMLGCFVRDLATLRRVARRNRRLPTIVGSLAGLPYASSGCEGAELRRSGSDPTIAGNFQAALGVLSDWLLRTRSQQDVGFTCLCCLLYNLLSLTQFFTLQPIFPPTIGPDFRHPWSTFFHVISQ
jgi:hypothetical protein